MLRCGTVARAAPSKRPASCVERGPVLGLLAADVGLLWAAVEAPHVPHGQVDEAQPERWPRGAAPRGQRAVGWRLARQAAHAGLHDRGRTQGTNMGLSVAEDHAT